MATWEKIVKHGIDYSKAITGSGDVYMENGSTSMISFGATDFLSELAVGQNVSISRDGTTEVKEVATIATASGATCTTNWGGSTGMATAHIEPGVEIDVANIGTVLHADASRLSVKRLAVDAESGTFGDIVNTNSVITANAGEKYYPMHLYGDRDTYGTALYIQQEGDGDSLIIQKAGDGFWTTGVDNSTDLFSIGYGNSSPFFSLNDVYLTIDTDGDVTLSADHGVGTDYSVVTKKYFEDNHLSFLTSGGRWYTKYNRWHTFNTTYGPNYYNHNKDTTVTDADPIDSTAGYTMLDSHHPPLIAPFDCTITGWSMHATTTSNQTYEVAVATANPTYGGSSADIAPGDQTLLGSIESQVCLTGKWYAWDPGAFSVDVDEGDFIIPYIRRSTNSTSYTYYMYGTLSVNLQPR